MSLSDVSRRALVPAALVALTAAGCGGGKADVPQDYQEFSRGPLSVMLPPQLVEVAGSGSSGAGDFDIQLQDDANPDAETLGMALVGYSDFLEAQTSGTEGYDAQDTLEWMVMVDPLGMAHPTLPDPVDLSRDGDVLWRQDVPRGPEDDVYYIWAGQDEETGVISTFAFGGPEVTQEMIDVIDQTFAVDPER